MWLTLIAAGLAHPFESRLYGHQTTLWLTAESVVVEYAVEIPTARLLAEIRESLPAKPTQADQDAFNDRLHRDLRDALRLQLDGEAVEWAVAEPTEDSGRGDVKFIVYRIQLMAPLPETARTIKLIDGNYPDEPSIYQTSVLVGDGVILDASSQLTVEDGELVSSREGLWRPEEESRELRLSFRRRSGMAVFSVLSTLGGAAPGLRPGAEVVSTRSVRLGEELSAGRLSPPTVGGVFGLAVLLGGAGGLRWWLLPLGGLLCGWLALVGLTQLSGVCLVGVILGAGVVRGAAKIAGRSG